MDNTVGMNQRIIGLLMYQDENVEYLLHAMNDSTEIRSKASMMCLKIFPCHEWWHRDSLHTMNDSTEISSSPW
jgi:hypothetical protein